MGMRLFLFLNANNCVDISAEWVNLQPLEVFYKKLSLNISQYIQENTCD